MSHLFRNMLMRSRRAQNTLKQNSRHDLEIDEEKEIIEARSSYLKSSTNNNIESEQQLKQSMKKFAMRTAKETDDDDDSSQNSSNCDLLLSEEDCYIPTFMKTKNCHSKLIKETRSLLKQRYLKNEDSFYHHDYQRMLSDDWAVSRFLLRRHQDPRRAAKLMEECGRFRKAYRMSEIKLHQFPIEFHQVGGLFLYEPDRVGNVTVYMRTKMYRRHPDLSEILKAFILCVLEEADEASGGRGVAIIFDLTECGLQNVDLNFLSWLLSSFRNYCPKGVSYIMVYNLPWFLNATCKLAMSWLSSSNRRVLRFVQGTQIECFIKRENLPDYLGGTCSREYRVIPRGSRPAIEICDQLNMTREQALKIRELFAEYLAEKDASMSELIHPQQENDLTLQSENEIQNEIGRHVEKQTSVNIRVT